MSAIANEVITFIGPFWRAYSVCFIVAQQANCALIDDPTWRAIIDGTSGGPASSSDNSASSEAPVRERN